MRRDAMFERGRNFRPPDDDDHALRLSEDRGERIGSYAPYEPNEYSDDYYGPGDRYERRGYEDDFNPPRQRERGDVGGIVLRDPNVRPTARPSDSGHYGELGHGMQSWGSLKRHMNERAGSHRGRGPKNYQRSDARLGEMICEMLTHDPDIDASEVHVAVTAGEVTLTGNVDDRRTKFLIEERIVARIGECEIHNQLRTIRPR
jgi:BON domain